VRMILLGDLPPMPQAVPLPAHLGAHSLTVLDESVGLSGTPPAEEPRGSWSARRLESLQKMRSMRDGLADMQAKLGVLSAACDELETQCTSVTAERSRQELVAAHAHAKALFRAQQLLSPFSPEELLEEAASCDLEQAGVEGLEELENCVELLRLTSPARQATPESCCASPASVEHSPNSYATSVEASGENTALQVSSAPQIPPVASWRSRSPRSLSPQGSSGPPLFTTLPSLPFAPVWRALGRSTRGAEEGCALLE